MNLKHIILYDTALTMSQVMDNHTALRHLTLNTTESVTDVKLNANVMNLNVGSSSTLIATIIPTNATNRKVTWSCDNGNCTIVPDGLTATVTGAAAGNSVITVTTVDGGLTATCNVTVTEGNDKKVTTVRYVTNGSVEKIAEGTYKLTNSSAWDKLALCGDTTEVPAGDYNICIQVIERNTPNIDGSTAKLQYQSTYAITGKTTLIANLLTCNLNEVNRQQVTIKSHTQTGDNARIAIVQFNGSNTGDHIVVKLWLERV